MAFAGGRCSPRRDGTLRRVLTLMAPRILDLGVFQLTLLVTANLASRLDAGSLSALEWGWDFMQLPETVIGTAFGLVALPTLAELAARRDLGALRQTMSDTLRAILGLTIPAAAGLILLGRPLLQVLYQRGAFDAGATEAVFVAVRFYALGLVGHACLEVAARAFFAQQDTVTPLLIAAGSAAVNIAAGRAAHGPAGPWRAGAGQLAGDHGRGAGAAGGAAPPLGRHRGARDARRAWRASGWPLPP